MAGDATKLINGKMFGKIGAGTAFNLALGVGFGVMDYKDAREQGAGVIGATTRAVGTGILSEVMGGWGFLGMQAAMAVPGAAVNAYEKLGARARQMSSQSRNLPFQNATFVDSPQAYTMRQSGMQLAQASRYNLQQSLLGNEAEKLHL